MSNALHFEWIDDAAEWIALSTGGPAGSSTLSIDHLQIDFDRCAPGLVTRMLIPRQPGPLADAVLHELFGAAWSAQRESPSSFEVSPPTLAVDALSRVALLEEDTVEAREAGEGAQIALELELFCALAVLRETIPSLCDLVAERIGVDQSAALAQARALVSDGESTPELDVVCELAKAIEEGRAGEVIGRAPRRSTAAQVPWKGGDATERALTPTFEPPELAEIFSEPVRVVYTPATFAVESPLEQVPSSPLWFEVRQAPEAPAGFTLLELSPRESGWAATAALVVHDPEVVIGMATVLDERGRPLDIWQCRSLARHVGGEAFRKERQGWETVAGAWWDKCADWWRAAGSPRRAAGAYLRAAKCAESEVLKQRYLQMALAHSPDRRGLDVEPIDRLFRAWLSVTVQDGVPEATVDTTAGPGERFVRATTQAWGVPVRANSESVPQAEAKHPAAIVVTPRSS